MDFNYNENQKLIAEMIRSFSAKEIIPNIKNWDDNQIFPVPVFKKLGELGLMGVLVPQEHGGSGFGYAEYVTAIEELAKVDPQLDYLWRLTTLYVQVILCSSVMKSKRKSTTKISISRMDRSMGLNRAQYRL
jgi:alkylation response protein AidB-like acyl-CoA dehydrogenase